jgi:hypothetical protein
VNLSGEASQQGDAPGEFVDGHFGAGADVDGIGAVIVLEREQDAFGAVLDMDEIAGGTSGAADDDFFRSGFDRLDEFSNQRRNHKTGARIEIIAGTIKIGGNQADTMKSVLLAVSERLNQGKAFGDAMFGASGVGQAFEEILLAQRDRSVRRVGGGAAQINHFFHAVAAAGFKQLGGHHHVVVESFGHVAMPIRAGHRGGEVNQQLGTGFVE